MPAREVTEETGPIEDLAFVDDKTEKKVKSHLCCQLVFWISLIVIFVVLMHTLALKCTYSPH